MKRPRRLRRGLLKLSYENTSDYSKPPAVGALSDCVDLLLFKNMSGAGSDGDARLLRRGDPDTAASQSRGAVVRDLADAGTTGG